MSNKIVDDAVEIAARESRAPEQADFMTAAVLNAGSMSAQERRWLQQDLEAIECGTSTDEYYEEEPDDDQRRDDEDDDLSGTPVRVAGKTTTTAPAPWICPTTRRSIQTPRSSTMLWLPVAPAGGTIS